ncbi:MAG: SPFH domain-containing protein [Gemmataceae bacterium]|nr:SPFH domain-containing protein [Gemmata sp.]MDW8198647.1 SPFH domain-containing protein [Gemmataceae bacterium]
MLKLRYLFLLLVVSYLATGIYQVGPDQRAVVRRFGQVVARPGPGLGFGWPWGIDQVDRIPVRTVRQLRVGYDPNTANDAVTSPGQMLTGDQNLVNIQLVLDYAIGETDADLDDYVLHRDRVEAILARATEAAMGEWAAAHSIDQVLLTGNAALPVWVMNRLHERLPVLRLGVRVQRASVAILAPPDEVRAAFEAVNQAETAIRTRETQARQQSEQRLTQANAVKYRLEQEAAQYRDEQLAQAAAEAEAFRKELMAFREVLKSHPDALAFLWWQEMQDILDTLTTRGSEVKPLDHYLLNGELNLYEVSKFFNPLRR